MNSINILIINNVPEDGTDFKPTTGFKLTQCDKILQ